jgi:hypothetical protein
VLGLSDHAALLLPAWSRALAAAVALFWMPGYLVTTAIGVAPLVTSAERPALYFVGSIAAALPALAAIGLAGAPLAAFWPSFAATLVVMAVLAVRATRDSPETHAPTGSAPAATTPRWLPALALAVVALTTLGAWQLTATGSIDRWWYLAYVRHYLDAGAIDFAEPLLGGGFVHPRFTFNAWLLVLAAWARLAAVDPVWLYEHACAPMLVPAAFSAVYMLARSLFSSSRLAWSATLAAGLLWASGSLFPALARMPEDKLLALLVIAPVTAGAIVRLLRGGSWHWLAVSAIAVAAQATTHALVYVIVLVMTVRCWPSARSIR